MTTMSDPVECKLPNSQCSRLWEEYAGWYRSVRGNLSHFEPDNVFDHPMPEPHSPGCSNRHVCATCEFYGHAVNFLHWEDVADDSNLCPGKASSTRSMISRTQNQVMTARWRGFTLTSPTPYVFYSTIGNDACGSIHNNILLPIIAESISTFVSLDTAVNVRLKKVDWRDFGYKTIGSYRVPMVPLSKYMAESNCVWTNDNCTVVYDDWHPVIYFTPEPTALLSVDPAWKYCTSQMFMAQDPVIVLRPIAVMELAHLHPITASNNRDSSPFPNDPLKKPPGDIQPTPGATQMAPYASQTQQDEFVPRPSPTVLSANDDSRVIVSRISIFTVIAGPVGTDIGYGAKVTDGTGAMSAATQRIKSEQLQYGKGDTSQQIADHGMLPLVETPYHREAIFAISGQTYTASQVALSPGAFALNSTIFSAGGPPITITGVIVSAIASGIVIQSVDLVTSAIARTTSASETRVETYENYRNVDAGETSTRVTKKKSGCERGMNFPWDAHYLGFILCWAVLG
jgi:hypothetical protein